MRCARCLSTPTCAASGPEARRSSTRVTDLGEPGFDLYVDCAQAGALKETLVNAGVVELDAATAEAVRIESGVPLFGRDMDEETIPLEAGIESRAISFSKGCYVGQEVIIRVLHRGHGRVARKLVGLTVDGDRVPEAGSTIRSGDREIGHVTSSAASPALKRPIALGVRPPRFPRARHDGDSRRSERHGHGAAVRHDVARRLQPSETARLKASRYSISIAISSASAGGNSSAARSSRRTHRIS